MLIRAPTVVGASRLRVKVDESGKVLSNYVVLSWLHSILSPSCEPKYEIVKLQLPPQRSKFHRGSNSLPTSFCCFAVPPYTANYSSTFDVRKSVHHHTIQINQPTRYNSFTSSLLDVYVWLNMFRASPRPSSGAYNCIRSDIRLALAQTTTNNAATATLQR